jgi:hypothetical protein
MSVALDFEIKEVKLEIPCWNECCLVESNSLGGIKFLWWNQIPLVESNSFGGIKFLCKPDFTKVMSALCGFKIDMLMWKSDVV